MCGTNTFDRPRSAATGTSVIPLLRTISASLDRRCALRRCASRRRSRSHRRGASRRRSARPDRRSSQRGRSIKRFFSAQIAVGTKSTRVFTSLCRHGLALPGGAWSATMIIIGWERRYQSTCKTRCLPRAALSLSGVHGQIRRTTPSPDSSGACHERRSARAALSSKCHERCLPRAAPDSSGA